MGTFLLASGNILEWIVVLLYVAAIIGVTVAETIWLYRNRWAEVARAISFTFVSNVVAFAVGGVIILVILLLLLMLTFENADRKGAWGGEATMIVLLVGLFSVIPVLLFFSKRLFLSAFRVRAGKPAWLYSLVSSLIVIMVGCVLPTVAAYIITKGGSAK